MGKSRRVQENALNGISRDNSRTILYLIYHLHLAFLCQSLLFHKLPLVKSWISLQVSAKRAAGM